MRRVCCVCCGAYFPQIDKERYCGEYCERAEKKRIERQSEVISSMNQHSLNSHLRRVGRMRKSFITTSKTPVTTWKKKKKLSRSERKKLLKPSELTLEQMMQQSDDWKRMNAVAYFRALEKAPTGSKTIKIISPSRQPSFYDSKEWLDLRKRVLKHWGHRCMCCGVTDTIMHVDHIKSRSKYPNLELVFENLQVLCWKCNKAKSNFNEINFIIKNNIKPIVVLNSDK